jgi:phage N-6-adenine-methyltransferase
MNTVVKLKDQPLVRFDPANSRTKQAALREAARRAAEINNWDALHTAIDGIIEEQTAYVSWYDATVRSAGNPIVVGSQQLVSAADITRATGIGKHQVSRWRRFLADAEQYHAELFAIAHARMWAAQQAVRVRTTAVLEDGDGEWHTPKDIIDRARQVLGRIDLDPASNPQAQQTVKARKYFTKDNDALQQAWHGGVWLNPPFRADLLNQFVSKLIAEYQAGSVNEAIMLVNNFTDAGWFQQAARVAACLCFTHGRIKFVHRYDGRFGNPTQGQCFFYFGKDPTRFRRIFAPHGLLVIPSKRNAARQ